MPYLGTEEKIKKVNTATIRVTIFNPGWKLKIHVLKDDSPEKVEFANCQLYSALASKAFHSFFFCLIQSSDCAT